MSIALILLQEDVCIETEEGLKQCKLIAVHAGLDKRKSVKDQLKLLRAKDTSISKLQQLNGRKDVWNMPQVKNKPSQEPSKLCILIPKRSCWIFFSWNILFQELDDKQTVVVSGHHGKLHVDGLRLIIDESGGYADKPLWLQSSFLLRRSSATPISFPTNIFISFSNFKCHLIVLWLIEYSIFLSIT